jgi:acyl-CoA thioesterase-1
MTPSRLVRAVLLLVLAGALAVPGPVARAGALPESCAVPADVLRLRGKLPRTALRLVRHETLTVVTLGSSSTEGIGASAPDKTYPSRFAASVHERLPTQPVRVLNKGVGGETAAQMAARLDRDVLAERPDLVIWQLGTNTVLRDEAIAPIKSVVEDGLERLREAGIDVVLMDLQYAPAVLAHPDYRDMEHALSLLAKENGVGLFRRFAVMRYWQRAEQLDFAEMLAPDLLHQNDLSYGCIGQLLADAVLDTALPSLLMSHR